MTPQLHPYPSYKASSLSWLDEIPAHWEIKRNGQLFVQREETGFADLPILEVSLRTGVRVRQFDGSGRKQMMSDRSKYKRAVKGDLAYNMMRMWQGAVGVAPEDGLISPAYVVATPRDGANARYYSELFRTSAYMGEVDAHSHGIVKDRNRLYWEDFKQIYSVYPPLDEQRAIVRCLSHLDLRVSVYVAAKQRLRALLEEQQRRITLNAITHGLNPDARLNPSGIEWLGRIPEHWELKRLKWVTRLQRGYDLPADARIDGPYPVVSSGGVIDSHSEFKSAGPGVVLGRYGSTESVFYVDSDFWPHNTSLFVTNFHGNFPRWCYYLLSSITKADNAGKSAVPGVDRKDLFQIVVSVPPVPEQMAIAQELDASSLRTETARATLRQEIALMLEYRDRFVWDLVVGKLDAREAAAQIPEEAAEVDGLSLPDSILEEGDEADADLDELVGKSVE